MVKDTYGDPDSDLFNHSHLLDELVKYRDLFEYELDLWGYRRPEVKQRISKAADEYAMAMARERYASIKESEAKINRTWESLNQFMTYLTSQVQEST